MKYCPITYEMISDKQNYSPRGLKLLSPRLINLEPLPFTAHEQRQEAVSRAPKMSLQGIQIKLSARLKIKENCFELVDTNGQYILKPQSEYYAELPENEALTMTLAGKVGIEVPIHGLIYSKDGSMTYFIKRFDRAEHHKKIEKFAVEDFAQLLQLNRETKYDSSMEKVAKVIKTYCSFPKIEATKHLKLTLFNFLIGNEDMHLKNFSLITTNQKITLSPAYDLLNSTIAQQNTKEELALPLNGKKNNLKKYDFLEYYAIKQLELNQTVINKIVNTIKQAIPTWKDLIKRSRLSQTNQEKYLKLLNERLARLL